VDTRGRGTLKRLTALGFLFAGIGVIAAGGQPAMDPKQEALLRLLFPSATAFSAKGGDPPHFKVYAADPSAGPQALAGLAFWTTELEPLERGYDGPIKVLVGMNTAGILAGIVVTDHHEPYGYFSVDKPEFAAQFKGKNIRDPFRVGGDIDAVSRATMTVSSATRAVRNSSRRVATQVLAPPSVKR
jgi:NosR/NirI family nitrous oxide reductase transcriptional regulator